MSLSHCCSFQRCSCCANDHKEHRSSCTRRPEASHLHPRNTQQAQPDVYGEALTRTIILIQRHSLFLEIFWSFDLFPLSLLPLRDHRPIYLYKPHQSCLRQSCSQMRNHW
uniref:Uncharacterized protein n=1 Tax=Rhizophora mucronata TaxID=61149 RepID=A0A2P2II01_RHIMU